MNEMVVRNRKGGASSSAVPKGHRFVCQLNDRWRVIEDKLQWILQVRKGRKTAKASGYRGRRYHVQRTALLRSIAEFCGEVFPAALEKIRNLPERHKHGEFCDE